VEHSNALTARLDRMARARPLLVDGLLAGVIWLVPGLLSTLVGGPTGLLLATVTIVPLAVRRRYPAAVLAWSAATFVAQLVILPIPLPANIAQALMIYTVAAHVPSLPVRLAALGVALAGCLAAGLRWSTAPQYLRNALLIAGFLAVFAVLTWLIGNVVRGRETNMRALRDAYARLEESRQHRVRFLAQRERVTAAREIHDIVAHSLTVVIVQADGAGYAAEHAHPWDRADAREVLATIARTARTALTEVRGVIDMLRDPDAGPGTADDPAGPPVSRTDLEQLVTTVRAAGLPVEVHADPAAFTHTTDAVRLVVLRVVRESLTNVLKHAGAHATAEVTVTWTAGAVLVQVDDDGAGPATGTVTAEPGHGVSGMRERLRALSGTLNVGPRPGGGFRVRATIPATGGTIR